MSSPTRPTGPANWVARAIEDVAEVGKQASVGWGLLRKILGDYRAEGGPPPLRKASEEKSRLATAIGESRKKEEAEFARTRAESRELKRKELEWAEGILANHAKRCEYPLTIANTAWWHIAKDDPRRIEAEEAHRRRRGNPWLEWFEKQPREFIEAFKSANAEIQDEVRSLVTKAKSPDILTPNLRKMIGLTARPDGATSR